MSQFDPPPTISQVRSTLTKIFNSPSAAPPEIFNIQEPLPPVPYAKDPPPPTIRPQSATFALNPVPTAPLQPLAIPKGASPPPPTINPVPRLAPPSGGAAAVITTTAGGVITGAGLVTGGLTVVAGALLIHDAQQLIKLFQLSQPESKPTSVPLRGGQVPGAAYAISGSVTELCTPFNNSPPVEVTWTFDKVRPSVYEDAAGVFYGPIEVLTKIDGFEYGGHTTVGVGLKVGSGDRINTRNTGIGSETPTISGKPVSRFEIPSNSNGKLISIDLVAIPMNATKDEENRLLQPQPQPQPKRSPIPSQINPTQAPQTISSPNKNGVNTPQSPPPLADNPIAINNRIPLTITSPSARPITITSPGAAPVVITPASQPTTIKITRPSASPLLSPTGISSPTMKPDGVPIAVSSPGSTPITLVSPGTTPITINYPGQQPIVIDPNTSKVPSGLQATPLAGPVNFAPTPISPTNPVISPTTPTTPTSPLTDPKDKDLQTIGLQLVGLTALIQGIQNNTSPQSLKAAAAAGTCQTTAPGGCTTAAINQGNQDLLNKLGAGAQGADLALLGVMNNKLGNQITGGLSGGLGRLSNFLGIDRILNIVNLMAILHNGFMLSNQLKVTLIELLGSVGNATGLLQTAEGDNVDLNETFNKGIQGLIDSVIGETERVRLELLFKRYNRIYQAGANIMNSMQSMINSLGEVLETTAEYTGKIGNSLMAAGAIAGNAFQWMSEKHDAKSSKFLRYQTSIGGVTQALEVISEISENVVEGQQAKIDADAATAKFKVDLAAAEKNPGIENQAVAAEIARQKAAATANTEGSDDTGLFSNLTD